jgi:alanine racemase
LKHLSEVQISSERLIANFQALKTIVRPCVKVAAVVKGNAYGHGLKEVVQVLGELPDAYQVDDLEELESLRQLTDRRALVFGYIPAYGLERAFELGAEIAIYDVERLPEISRIASKLGRPSRVHLKVDALLGRQGVLPGDLEAMLLEMEKFTGIELVSAYSHFANIEDTTDMSHAQAQSKAFEDSFLRVQKHFPALGRHESATSGLMAHESSVRENDLVRIGIGLYGLYPSPNLAKTYASLNLKPVMRWITRLAQVKTLPKGHPVGYGLTYIASESTRIGIVPVGYSDGYDRGLSNCGHVLVGGAPCKVIGRVAMNMFAIDLSNCRQAKAEHEVVLLGSQGASSVSAEKIAEEIGTINYEITTRVSPLLPRVVTK